MLGVLAGGRPDLVATLGQDRHGRAPDAARGARHEHRPVRRIETALLERDDAHRRGEPGRADGHRLTRTETRRHRHDPVAWHTLVGGVSTMPAHAEFIAVCEDRVPGTERRVVTGDHDTRQVDAGDERADPGDLAGRDRRERVLVVHAGPLDPDGHLAGWQVGRAEVSPIIAAFDALVDPLRRRRRETSAASGPSFQASSQPELARGPSPCLAPATLSCDL